MLSTFSKKIIWRFASEGSTVALPQLKYGYSDLEPVLSGKLIELHYKKHHQTYVTNLNSALNQFDQAKVNFDYKKNSTYSNYKIQFGWSYQPLYLLGKPCSYWQRWRRVSSIRFSIDTTNYQAIWEMTKKSLSIQGSGWGWLAWDNISNSLRIVDTPNQEMVAPRGLNPLLTIDVWQHAYDVDYKNMRDDYFKQIWKIVNWKDVERRFLSVASKK